WNLEQDTVGTRLTNARHGLADNGGAWVSYFGGNFNGDNGTINHALHLLCAAAWFGGLLPVVYCMRMAQGRWRQHAISAMMRF
ncbi:hypothetical protein ONJ45_27840, partial [Salmonella enterica subsp. enterica serovar Virginia]|nr:hypothetical protein [Salmonella enterica subsp. enterica serovar Virginia]